MAASDYEVRAQGNICPSGFLQAAVGHLDTTFTITGFKASTPTPLKVGMAAMVGAEIVRVESITLPDITVARGCADTLPAPHAADVRVWFFSEDAVGDQREYTATDTVGVKVLPFTQASGPVPIVAVPPVSVTFNWRHQRPYAPGNLQVKGTPWFDGPKNFAAADTQLTFTWAHRDRLLQADQLIGHTEASVGPEPGVTYTAVVKDHTGTVVRTVAGITGTTWNYTRVMASADLTATDGSIEFFSVRAGLDSWEKYVVQVRLAAGGGLGETLGENLGG